MARIRSVHPGFFTDEDLVSVCMAARLLFIGLGVEADDKGIFEWKPLTLKMRVFPADNLDVAGLLIELANVGAIKKFEAEGRTYGAIRNFRKFQKPKTPNDIHPASAEILAFVGLPISETKSGDEAPFPPKGEKSSQMEDGGGRGGEEEEKPSGSSSSARKRANPRPVGKTMLSDDWLPAQFGEDTKCRKIVDSWPPGELEHQVEKFHASHTSRGSMFDDWQAAWKTWVLNSVEYRGRNARPSTTHAPRDNRDGFTQVLHERAGLGDAAQPPGAAERRAAGDGGDDRELPPARLAANR